MAEYDFACHCYTILLIPVPLLIIGQRVRQDQRDQEARECAEKEQESAQRWRESQEQEEQERAQRKRHSLSLTHPHVRPKAIREGDSLK